MEVTLKCHNILHLSHQTSHKPCLLGGSVVVVIAKLRALVYDILPSTTAVFSYAIGSRKLDSTSQAVGRTGQSFMGV